MNAKRLTLSKYDFEKGIHAEFKWSISRGYETQGDNICSLYVNGTKVSDCMGGGYDMQGTALGDWMEVQFPEELKTLEPSWTEGPDYIPCPKCKGKQFEGDGKLCSSCRSPFGRIHNPDYKRGGFYGMLINRANTAYGTVRKWQEGDKIALDGGCGISCMQAILTAIGYEMQWIPTRKKNDSQYWIKPAGVEVMV